MRDQDEATHTFVTTPRHAYIAVFCRACLRGLREWLSLYEHVTISESLCLLTHREGRGVWGWSCHVT